MTLEEESFIGRFLFFCAVLKKRGSHVRRDRKPFLHILSVTGSCRFDYE